MENARLQARLEDAEETLRAIRSGNVDALVVDTAAGPQVFNLEGVDAEANRFRGELLMQINDAIIVTDAENRVIYLNFAAERLYGVPMSEALGRDRSDIYEVRWQHPEEEAAKMTALSERGHWRGENVHVRRDGGELFVESSVSLLRDTIGFRSTKLAVIRDVSERKQHEHRILTSEIRYRRLFETAHDGVLLLDPDTLKIVDANPFMTQLLGYPREELVGKELFEIGLLKDEAASQEMVRELKRSKQVRYEDLPLESSGGRHQEVEVIANLYDENGRPVIQCNIRDITERKRAEVHVNLLLAEVNHRAKNLLAVVQVIARQTAKSGDVTTFAQRLSDRIDGLAAGQDLMVKNQWHGIGVEELIESQLIHFKDLIGTRLLVDGPRVRLTISAAQGIGMALHELGTNAAKYGSLSGVAGQVHISWQVTAVPEPMFSMAWREDGGPKVKPPALKSFGQVVIGRMAESAVDGAAEIIFREEGLSWTLKAPAENVVAPNGATL